jgi:acyl-CoA reductase-like NAD-dependent aldehyde dehydrogenase
VIAVLVVVPGCGGGGGQPLTREQFASKADAICAKGNDRQKQLGNPASIADLARVADKTLDILDDAIADFAKLKPPASERVTAEQWIAQVRLLRDDLKQIRDQAKAKDTQALRQIAAMSQTHNTRAKALATELGMKVCNTG